MDQYRKWQDFKDWCQEHGRDICYLTLSVASAIMASDEAATVALKDPAKVVNISMSNVFAYTVNRPRRLPYDLSCIKPAFQKTFSSVVMEAYILYRARKLGGEICFRDFLELKPAAFRRIVRRLVKKGELVANPQRTIPKFYFLPEKLGEYVPSPSATE